MVNNDPKSGPLVSVWNEQAAGLGGVWARENTREAIWDALKRKEVYATTGDRPTVRVFAGWDFAHADLERPDFAANGYAHGVPMGGDLSKAPAGKRPVFLVYALRDPDGPNLDRIQIIKGWLGADGKTQERIFDVAVSGGRTIGPDGRCKTLVGSTVDVANATYTNTIGAATLSAYWEDPAFDATQRAFYYVRVIQIPSPRWTAYDQKRYGIKMPDYVPMTVTDRAYTSPIWYSPAKWSTGGTGDSFPALRSSGQRSRGSCERELIFTHASRSENGLRRLLKMTLSSVILAGSLPPLLRPGPRSPGLRRHSRALERDHLERCLQRRRHPARRRRSSHRRHRQGPRPGPVPLPRAQLLWPLGQRRRLTALRGDELPRDGRRRGGVGLPLRPAGRGLPILREPQGGAGHAPGRVREVAAEDAVGFSLKVVAPTGQYDPTKLINWGANRWAFRPELGLSRRWGHWVLDAYGGVWFYTTNPEYFSHNALVPGTQTQSQAPIVAFETHLSYDVRSRFWVSLDGNFWTGGRTSLNGVENPATRQQSSRVGVSASFPLTRHQSVKASYANGAYVRFGGDFQVVSLAWQYSWIGRPN